MFTNNQKRFILQAKGRYSTVIGSVKNMQIGEKIKQLRIKNQLTLEELANRSELTKGFLSQVERNLTSPSIATLEDILEALGTSLGEFFSEEKDEQIVFTANDFFENFQEDYNIYYVVPNAQKNRMEPILIHFKKAVVQKKFHRANQRSLAMCLPAKSGFIMEIKN